MKKNKLTFILAPTVIFCWCFFLLQSCKKDPVIEDTELLTSDDNLNLGKDTLHTKVFSEFELPLASNGISNGVLGTLTDPNFGTTYAGFYAQCQLTSNNIYFGEAPILDSAVLTLKYNGLYGKSDQPVNITVFELAESLTASTTYYTNTAFQVSVPALGQVPSFVPNTTDSIVAVNGTFPAHIRVKLSDSFGSKILTADTSTLRDNASFLNLFKGLYVTTSSSASGNGLTYINLSSSISGITLFYRNNTADSLFYTLPVSGVTVNHIDNIYAGTPVNTSVSSPNANGEEKLYLQAGAGAKGKIFITDLDSLPKNIAINKAELVLSQSASDTSYAAPLVLELFRINDVGTAEALEDDAYSGFGGVRVAETVNGVTINRYRFNLRRYFQKLLQGVYHNNGFYLQTYIPNANSERVVIANSAIDENYKLTLVVTYTKL
ncbi:MAG: DUF4270 family protein [Bacteroidota bacterium]